MNVPRVQTHPTGVDAACSDPMCSYRAEIESGYWVHLEADRLARAIAKARRISYSCTVLHTDQYGNSSPCPDGPRNEADAIAAAYADAEREGES